MTERELEQLAERLAERLAVHQKAACVFQERDQALLKWITFGVRVSAGAALVATATATATGVIWLLIEGFRAWAVHTGGA